MQVEAATWPTPASVRFGPTRTRTAPFLLTYLNDPATRDALLSRAVEHAGMVLIALGIGALVGLALGALASRSPAATRIVRAGGVGMLALPSLAAFALLLALFGTDSAFATIGLTLYATAMFARSTVLALRQVDPAVRDAARALGLSWPRRVATVEVVTAWPSLLAGLRIVALTLVPVGAVAAVFDGPGLGRVLLEGITSPDHPHRLAALVAGTVLLLLLAYGLDLLLVTVGRLTISGGLRD